MSSLSSLINKRVPLTFMGERLFFDLSHALFSSYKIDDGSRLLLKTLAKQLDFDKIASIADIGCGVGTLALSLKKRFPHTAMTAVDRDTLAVSMTRHNAELNKIVIDESGPALMDELDFPPVDLIVSNIPAKAGTPVHRAFLESLSSTLKAEGTAALVIVTPLEESFRSMIISASLSVSYEEKTANHLVLHLKALKENPREKTEEAAPLGRAFRQTCSCSLAKREYSLESVYGLPEFDTPSYGAQTAAELVKKRKITGRILFLNPGQGHIAAWAAGNGPDSMIVAGRDLLELKAAARNTALNSPETRVESTCTPWPAELTGISEKCSWAVVDYSPVPEAPPEEGFAEIADILVSGGNLLIYGRSSDLHTLLKKLSGFSNIDSRKYRGYRACLLKKG